MSSVQVEACLDLFYIAVPLHFVNTVATNFEAFYTNGNLYVTVHF